MRYQYRDNYSLAYQIFGLVWLVVLLYFLVQLLIFVFKLVATGVVIATSILLIIAVPVGIIFLACWGYRLMRQRNYSCVHSLMMMLSCGMSGFSLSYLKFFDTYSILIPLISLLSSMACLVMLTYSPVKVFKKNIRHEKIKNRLICP